MTVHLRAAMAQPTTFDPVARTVEAIVSTGAPAARPGHVEILDLRGVDHSRLIGGPVLDAHRTGSSGDQLGVIDAAELRSEGLWVRMRFRQTEAALAVMRDIADGTLRGLSIGYTVSEFKETRDGDTLIRTATRWTPLEVSIVPVPADAGAHFRNEESMNAIAPPPNLTADQRAVETRAQANVEIRSIAAIAGQPPAWADAQIDAGATPDAARTAAFAAMQQRSAQTATRTTRAEIGTDNTDPAVVATRAGEALYGRNNPDHKLSEPARQYAYMSLVDHARDCLRRSGVSVQSLSVNDIIGRAMHTTSDYPMILGDAVGREVRRSYEAAPSGVRTLARQTVNPDFRPKRKIMLGEAPDLEFVGEGGELKYGTIAESQETIILHTSAKGFAVSRQVQVNDDRGALVDVPRLLGVSSREYENSELVKKITANPVMSDGVAVFDTAHGNTSTGPAINIASLSVARVAMRKQKGLSGRLIDVTPRYVLVPPELETAAEQQLAELQATQFDNVNPFSNLTLVVEPRLTSATQWYVVADPALVDGLEYAYLEGAPGPQIETRVGFEVDGIQIKVRLDFGCAWIDHRSWHRVG